MIEYIIDIVNQSNNNTILIIDAYGLLFRSYYGIPAMHTSKGTNVNAVYGMMRDIINMLINIRHDKILVALDGGGKTFRHDILTSYKANRKDCPEDLIPQFGILDEILDAMHILAIRIPRYEADDIIASYTQLACENNYSAVIASYDKDLAQLVNDNVSMYSVKTKSFTHPQQVLQHFGVNPEQIPDYLSMLGDASDNIPGITGIGPKTAAKLINQYNTMDNIINNIHNIPQAISTKIKNNIESLHRAKRMIKLGSVEAIHDTADFHSIASFNYAQYEESINQIFDKYEMHSLVKSLKRIYNNNSSATMDSLF